MQLTLRFHGIKKEAVVYEGVHIPVVPGVGDYISPDGMDSEPVKVISRSFEMGKYGTIITYTCG